MTLHPKRRTALLLAGLALAGVVLAEDQGTAPAAPTTETSAIDPAAMQALDRMGAYLRGLTSFSLRADDAVDEVLDTGQKLQITKTVEFQVHKPDRLHAEITTDRKAREIFFDGKHFTLLAPEARYFTTVAAPPTIREMLTALETKYDIELPLRDLFLWGDDTDAAADIQEAMRVGTSNIAGQLADHYAFRQDEIDWQIWIAQGEAPLPLRYVITTKNEPGEPQYMANLTWDTQAKPADAVFTFTPSKDDHPIAIVVQDETPATQEGNPQ